MAIFATNVSGGILLPSSIQVTESISGSVVLLAMFGLYACIGYVGVILSTILQSTRGIMSVILGAILSGQGWRHLESRVERHVFFRRLIAALCMTTAVALYVVSNHDFPQTLGYTGGSVSKSLDERIVYAPEVADEFYKIFCRQWNSSKKKFLIREKKLLSSFF